MKAQMIQYNTSLSVFGITKHYKHMQQPWTQDDGWAIWTTSWKTCTD